MGRKDRSRVGRTLCVTFFAALLLAGRNASQAQERVGDPPMPEQISSADRLARIEGHLQKLESHNQQLQKRYDELSKKYEAVLQESKNPVFGMGAGNSDGKGIPGGVNVQSAAFLQGGRDQTGTSGAGVPRDGPRTHEPEEDQGEEIEATAETSQVQRRFQTGTAGPGQVIEGQGPELMADYVDVRGPYVPDMRPIGLPGTIRFREGVEFRAADDFFTLEFHNLSQLDLRLFDQTGDALHDNFFVPRQRWYFQGQVTPYAYHYTVINRGYGSLEGVTNFSGVVRANVVE